MFEGSNIKCSSSASKTESTRKRKEHLQEVLHAVELLKDSPGTIHFNFKLKLPSTHELIQLEDYMESHFLSVSTMLGMTCPRPLPRSRVRPPSLTVNCKEATCLDDIERVIVDLAPTDGKYSNLKLVQWTGDEEELEEMVDNLVRSGVRTGYAGVKYSMSTGGLPDSENPCYICYKAHENEEKCLLLFVCDSNSP